MLAVLGKAEVVQSEMALRPRKLGAGWVRVEQAACYRRGVLHVPNRRREPDLMSLPRCLLRTHARAAAYVAVKHLIPAARALHASAPLRAIDMAKVNTTERLAELRKLMKERNVDIYSTDKP